MKSLCSIFKKQGNQKGFSLVELLIVIAIMGVLAVIAFNAFNGVLVNSKKRADDQQAKIIEKAIRLLMTDTGKFTLKTAIEGKNVFFTSSTAASSYTTGTSTSTIIGSRGTAEADQPEIVKDLIIGLQNAIYVKDAQGIVRNYGPYLTPPNGLAASYDYFKPQADTSAGGEHVGYSVKIFPSTQNVTVAPVTVLTEAVITQTP